MARLDIDIDIESVIPRATFGVVQWRLRAIFFLAGAQAPGRQGGQGQCGGTGLPNGAVGDYSEIYRKYSACTGF
mgnify:CR=1 FL=1